MQLQVKKRAARKKSENKSIRRAGNIPAILYVEGKDGDVLSINGVEFTSLLRKVQQGRLSTTVFELVEEDGTIRKAILKDIQYDPTNYKVIHLDFEELVDNVEVKVKIPIECTGVVDCVGIKLGGALRQVIRALPVRCLPKDIPSVFMLDIRSMNINDSKRLSEIDIPNTLKPQTSLNEVAVVISKR